MKSSLIIVTCIILCGNLFGQATSFIRTYGGNDFDGGFSGNTTYDDGYIIAGKTKSLGNGKEDMYLIKIDESGGEKWSKTFGGVENETAFSVQQTFDSGFVVLGETQSYGSGNLDVYLVKTDNVGNEVWTKTFGGIDHDWGLSIQQTMDSGFIIVSVTESAGPKRCSLIKTNKSGNEEWSKDFDIMGYEVQQTFDSGFVIIGTVPDNNGDVYLLRTDKAGNEMWNKTFGGSEYNSGKSVQETSDSGFIITGAIESGNGSVYLVKTDKSGNEIWSGAYGGKNTEGGFSVRQTTDDGFIVTGTTGTFSGDVFLLKVNSSGIEMWLKTFGGYKQEEATSVKETVDRGFIITGYSNSFGPGDHDVYCIKTDEHGNVATRIIYVNDNATGSNNGTSWTDAFLNLQDALTVSQPGDSIFVAAGTYFPHPTDRDVSFALHSVSLFGHFTGIEGSPVERDINNPFYETILSGDIGVHNDSTDNSFNIVNVLSSNSIPVIIDGFTIAYSNDNGNASSSMGGGILSILAKLRINNCLIKNNVTKKGAGMFAYRGSTQLNGCIFRENKAREGGGIYLEHDDENNPMSVTMDNCTFLRNICTDDWEGTHVDGGGIYIFADGNSVVNFTMEKCTLSENSAKSCGAILMLGDEGMINPTFNNCLFQANSGNTVALVNLDFGTAKATIVNCRFTDNLSSGFVTYCINSAIVSSLGNCLFKGNYSDSAAYGIFSITEQSAHSIMTLTNCTVYNTYSTNASSGGLYCSRDITSTCSTSVQNSIFWDNGTSDQIVANNTIVNVNNSCIQGGWSGTGNHNIDQNPQFISTDDLHLRDGSPAIDKGNNDYVTKIMSDLDGSSRIQGSFVDMGVYEKTGIPVYTISFSVRDEQATPIQGASVVILPDTFLTDLNGQVTFDKVNGTYSYTVSSALYQDASSTVIVNGSPVAETVTLINSIPGIVQNIQDITVKEDTSDIAVADLNTIFDDAEESGTLVFSIEHNSNTALVTPAIQSTGSLMLHFTPQGSGSAMIVIKAKDTPGASVNDTFFVTVQPVNDVPFIKAAITDVTVDEDAPLFTHSDLHGVFNDIEILGHYPQLLSE